MSRGARTDGRRNDEMREMTVSLGRLDRADGSAQFGFGGTAALASVSGPIEAGLREELPDKATFRILHRPLEGVGATPSKAIVNTLQNVFPPLLSLGQHPRSLIQLIIQSLSPDPSPHPVPPITDEKTWPPNENYIPTAPSAPMSGMYFSARSAAMNAATLALLDAASIGMKAVPVSIALVIDREGRVLVDPTMEEEEGGISRYIFGWAFGSGISSEGRSRKAENEMEVDEGDRESFNGEAELVWAESEGDFTRSDYEKAMSIGRTKAVEILAYYREALSSHLSEKLKLRSSDSK